MSGKGDAPRPCSREKWDACPLWRKVGPDVRKDAQRKNRTNAAGQGRASASNAQQIVCSLNQEVK